jgi:hypothetical protein
MKVEYKTKSLVMDDKFKAEVDALVSDGWGLVPGTMPVVIYHLQRQVGGSELLGVGAGAAMSIDDSKVEIIRANSGNGN